MVTEKIKSNGINITDWDCKIYRIYSIDRFKKLLETKKNGLVSPEMWGDPFENFFLNCDASHNNEKIDLSSIRKSWYGQCWTKTKDSDAMWRIYSHEKTGVRVSTTIWNLFSNFYDENAQFPSLKFLIGEVCYMNQKEIENFIDKISFYELVLGGQPHGLAKTLCIKREAFQHENEIRLLYYDQDNVRESYIEFGLNPNTVFNEVTLDPRLQEDNFYKLKNELEMLGCSLPINQSDLYKFNRKTIKLMQ